MIGRGHLSGDPNFYLKRPLSFEEYTVSTQAVKGAYNSVFLRMKQPKCLPSESSLKRQQSLG